MKIRIALLCLVGVLALGTTADAAGFLPFGIARKYSKLWTKEECEAHGPSCVGWKVGHCARIYAQRVDCVADLRFRSGAFCVFILENRLKRNGYVHQRRRHTRCG